MLSHFFILFCSFTEKKKGSIPAPSKSKPGGSSGPQPLASRAPVDPSPQMATPAPLWPTPAGSDRQGLRPAAPACPCLAPWLALAGWLMGVLLGLILSSICASALGIKIFHVHCNYCVFCTYERARYGGKQIEMLASFTEENKFKIRV